MLPPFFNLPGWDLRLITFMEKAEEKNNNCRNRKEHADERKQDKVFCNSDDIAPYAQQQEEQPHQHFFILKASLQIHVYRSHYIIVQKCRQGPGKGKQN